MKYFYVISNLSKDYVLDVQDEVQNCLEKRGAVCRFMTGHERMKNGRHTPSEYVPEDTQCIITIGGDGTLIQAARDLAGRNIPMLGVNRGHLGFLNQVDRTEDIDAAMDALVNDRFRLERRMMLRGTVFHEGKPVFQDIALNEIVLTRQDVLQMLHFQVYLNDTFFNEYMADGIIAATPTGSTAYNLSAGGPIVAPGAQLMLLTPICSHSISARSIVLSPEDRISIRLVKWSGGKSYSAVFDGDQVFPLHYGEKLEICRAPKYTTLIQLKNVSFLENIRQKMNRI